MSLVKFVHATADAEKLMAYCARASNPSNQDNPEFSKLLGYCAKNGHWSVFEMASMCVEITTSRAIAPQILRHRSFSFQEFSQRYASPTDYVIYEARRQDEKNRQNSVDDLSEETKKNFLLAQEEMWTRAKEMYDASIAAASPDVVLKLIERIETMTGLVQAFVDKGHPGDGSCNLDHYSNVECDCLLKEAREALKAGEK